MLSAASVEMTFCLRLGEARAGNGNRRSLRDDKQKDRQRQQQLQRQPQILTG
jgi:hypothetical protein